MGRWGQKNFVWVILKIFFLWFCFLFAGTKPLKPRKRDKSGTWILFPSTFIIKDHKSSLSSFVRWSSEESHDEMSFLVEVQKLCDLNRPICLWCQTYRTRCVLPGLSLPKTPVEQMRCSVPQRMCCFAERDCKSNRPDGVMYVSWRTPPPTTPLLDSPPPPLPPPTTGTPPHHHHPLVWHENVMDGWGAWPLRWLSVLVLTPRRDHNYRCAMRTRIHCAPQLSRRKGLV